MGKEIVELSINDANERNIWNFRENNPNLVIEDCRKEFGLSEQQLEKLHLILIVRGVAKWLFCRRKFIKLKHKVKEMLREESEKGVANRNKEKFRTLQFINVEMQHIAKMPRWVEFPKTITHNWKNIERDIVVKGKHC